MPSPVPAQLPSTSDTPHHARPRSNSGEKPALVHRTSSTSSLHRTVSGKSNSSTGTTSRGASGSRHHVAHTKASTKHHRGTSSGHRVPSYGKGLNKLTPLTSVTVNDQPKEHASMHSTITTPGAGDGTDMQRSLSEGAGI
jgi:hypothetical protein